MPTLKVLIKGLNKVVEFPQDTKMEVIEQSIKGGWNEIEKISGLPMDQASRMERAKYLGFNPDERFFHGSKTPFIGTPGGDEARAHGLDAAEEMKRTHGGTFFSPDEEVASSFAGETFAQQPGEFLLSKGRAFDARWENMSDSAKDELRETVGSVFDEDDINDVREALGDPDWDPFESYTDGELYLDAGRDMQNNINQALHKKGYDTVVFPDSQGLGHDHVSTVSFDPSKTRSIHAEFDPSQQKSGNLLASASGAAVLGGLAATNDAQAATSSPTSANGTQPTNLASYLMANPTRLTPEQARQIFNQQKIEAPRHPVLHDIANLMRKVDTPFGPMFEATPDMLDRWAYGEGTSYFDKLMATLEIAPI